MPFLQRGIWSVEAPFPQRSELLDPVHRLLKLLAIDPAGAQLGLAAFGQQAGFFQHFDMFRDGRQAHLERRGQFIDRGFPLQQALEHGPPCGVGQGGEGQTHGICCRAHIIYLPVNLPID